MVRGRVRILDVTGPTRARIFAKMINSDSRCPNRLFVRRNLVVGGRAIVVVIDVDIVGRGAGSDRRYLDPDRRCVGRRIPAFDFVLEFSAGGGFRETHVRARRCAEIKTGEVGGIESDQDREVVQIVGHLE